MTLKTIKLALPILILPLVGVGCFKISPRIAKAPQSPTVAESSPQQPSSAEKFPVLAYVDLQKGAATVTRGDSTVTVQDGLALQQGDEVHVIQGPVDLVYPDAGRSELATGTKFVIIPDDEEGGAGVFVQVRLEAGNIWTRFERLFGHTERFSVAASGVVATIRGTAFGVSIKGDSVDVQVANHTVQVTAEEPHSSSAPSSIPHVVELSAGQGLHITAKSLLSINTAHLAALVHRLTPTERRTKGFIFGSRRILLKRLHRPLHPVMLSGTPVVSPALEKRIEILRRAAMIERVFPKFAAPIRAPLQQKLRSPTSTAPTIQGPTGTLSR